MATSTFDVGRTSQSEQVARSAGIVSLGIGVSRLTALVREIVMAHQFGAGFSYDAFLLGFRIPNLTRDLFAEGALSSAFVPAFTTALTRDGRREAMRLAHLVSTMTILVVGLLCVFGMIFAPQLVGLLAPGFALVPGKFVLAVRLTRIMFPFLLLVALAAQAAGMLNSYGVFGLPALAATAFNLGSLACGLVLGFSLGPSVGITPIEGMAYGVVIGGILQLAWQLVRLRDFGFSCRVAWQWSHPALRQVMSLMIPAILGNAAVQINVIVNTSFASRLADPLRGYDGPVSWLGYAMRFIQVPLGLFGVAFASAMLPSLARNAAHKNFEEFRKTLSRSLSLVFLFTIPSSVALVLLGRPIIGVIFESGRFEAYDTRQTALALACYSVGLLAYASVKILNAAFYVLSDARTPMYASLLSIAVNVCVPLVLLNYFHFGFASLALTTALAVTIEGLLLLECLRRKLGGIEGHYLASRFARVTVASLLMGAAIFWISRFAGDHLAAGRAAYWGQLALAIPAAGLTFFLAAQLAGLKEIGFATGLFLAPLRARFLTAHARIRS